MLVDVGFEKLFDSHYSSLIRFCLLSEREAICHLSGAVTVPTGGSYVEQCGVEYQADQSAFEPA